jgi:hypothetical protein
MKFFKIIIALWVVCLVGYAQPTHTTHSYKKVKPRIIITADPELDDNNSLIRFLLYSTDFRVEGLIYASSQFHWKGDGKGTLWYVPNREYGRVGMTRPMTSWRYVPKERFIHENVETYAKVYKNLKVHHPDYPTPEYLLSKIREGNVAFDGDFSKDTPGSELIKQCILNEDDSPLYIQAWGGASTIARALKSIEEIYSEQPYWKELKARISKKVVLCLSMDQDDTYARYIHPFWPEIEELNPNGMQVDLTFFAPLRVKEENKVFYSPEWTGQYIRSKGLFGERYRVWGDGKQMVKGDIFDFFGVSELGKEKLKEKGYILWMPTLLPKGTFISEGDTFCYLNLIDNGLRADEDPTFGGWTGAKMAVPADVKAADIPAYVRGKIGFPDFTAAVQNGFAARMAWSVTDDYKKANHEPVIQGIEEKSVHAGERVTLSCKVTDPDKDKITIQWRQFLVGSYPNTVTIEKATTNSPIITIPTDAQKGQTIHLVLEATDNGTPSLTRYHRIILTVK